MVTKIEDIKKYADGVEVALPGFVLGEQFIVKLKRPSLMKLAQEEKIPNQLLGAASTIFNEGVSGSLEQGEKFNELGGAVLCLAKAALSEPTYEELEEAGIELTDEQLFNIYLFTQRGVNMLEGFREEEESEPDPEPVRKAKKTAK